MSPLLVRIAPSKQPEVNRRPPLDNHSQVSAALDTFNVANEGAEVAPLILKVADSCQGPAG